MHVIPPIAQDVDPDPLKMIGVIDPPPLQAVRHPEPFQHAGNRSAGPDPREIVRTSVEAMDNWAAAVPRLAEIAVTIAAGQYMMIEHHHLQAGISEQGRCRQSADASADNRDV